eukprot:gnl/MRDRNA2_/MRDRNA2_224138_c0_seq1.p1 gnl/MRDRNA2_/MRDRNA2_224138_c0~~gnl/MRDRNA2_/MRDRNA2_224138_c0_seq1.p1  ORF type:complete len:308 (+),score=44.23 gnl/MRDRNA2_/MRDRNA2_224138_c0_seq1:87-926(+)
MVPALRNILAEEAMRAPADCKVIVFFPTARLAAFAAKLFKDCFKVSVEELHARRDAHSRIVTQHRFTSAATGVLFTSGVSERGMDYPGVTLVVQIGAPVSREQYIHSVGRTARAGRAGRSMLLLSDQEVSFLGQVSDLSLIEHPQSGWLLHLEENLARDTNAWAMSKHVRAAADAAFASLLVHYIKRQKGLNLNATEAITAAFHLVLGCGVGEQPNISRALAVELGLENESTLQLSDTSKDRDTHQKMVHIHAIGEKESSNANTLEARRRRSSRRHSGR